MACAKLHTFTGAGTLVQPQTPHQISRDSSITQMWPLLAWELLWLPRPAWLCPQPPCTLCMHTDSGSVVSALASGHKPHSSPSSPCLLPHSLVQQPSLVPLVPLTPRLHILLQPPGAKGKGKEGCTPVCYRASGAWCLVFKVPRSCTGKMRHINTGFRI